MGGLATRSDQSDGDGVPGRIPAAIVLRGFGARSITLERQSATTLDRVEWKDSAFNKRDIDGAISIDN